MLFAQTVQCLQACLFARTVQCSASKHACLLEHPNALRYTVLYRSLSPLQSIPAGGPFNYICEIWMQASQRQSIHNVLD